MDASGTESAPETVEGFSIGRGAPFLRLQESLGLLAPGSLAAPRRAVVFALLAWLPLLALTAAAGTLLAPDRGRSFLHDLGIHARLLLAVPIFVFLEPLAEQRLARKSRELLQGGLVSAAKRDEFTALVAETHRRRDSGRVEALLAALAFAGAATSVRAGVRLHGGSWAGEVGTDGLVHLSSAGWWLSMVAAPVFLFLGLRWLWRYALWVGLLRRVARIGLDVVPTHPDRCGGLAFLGQYPATFSGLAFALTAVVAASMARLLLWGGVQIENLAAPIALWGALVVGAFTLPLLVFAAPLREAKQRALLDYATLSLRHNRAFERRWFSGDAHPEEILGAADPSSLADLATGYQAVKAMWPVPIVAEGIAPVVVATALPLLCAVATQVPLRTMLEVVRRVLL